MTFSNVELHGTFLQFIILIVKFFREVTSDGTKKHPSDFSRDAKSRELNMSFSEQNNHRSSISRKKAHGKTSAEQDENEEGEELDLGFLGREARKLGQLILKSIFDTVNLENGDEDND